MNTARAVEHPRDRCCTKPVLRIFVCPQIFAPPFAAANAKRRRSRDQKYILSGDPHELHWLGIFMVDDKDIPISYIFYVLAVIAVMAFLICGGLFLCLR